MKTRFESLTLCRRYPPVIGYSHGTFSKKNTSTVYDIYKWRILHCHVRFSVYMAGLLRPRTFFLISWLIRLISSTSRKVDQFDHLTHAHQPWLCWSAMSLLEEPQWDSHLAICQRLHFFDAKRKSFSELSDFLQWNSHCIPLGAGLPWPWAWQLSMDLNLDNDNLTI